MFYPFIQNNSGGVFQYDESAGITHMVFFEADKVEEAIWRAEDQGLYFNDSWRDCQTCGSRWYEPGENEGTEEPSLYGKPISEMKFGSYPQQAKWMDGYEIFVHYKDERGIVGYGLDRNGWAVRPPLKA